MYISICMVILLKDWKRAIQSIRKTELPSRKKKNEEFYEAILDRVDRNEAVEIDADIAGRNTHSLYYSIRKYLKEKGIVDDYKFKLDKENSKIYIYKA